MVSGLKKLKSIFYRYALRPIMIACADKLYRWANQPQLDHQPAWKQNALDDFADWLKHLPQAPEQAPVSADNCDLFTLLREFSALRQEIKFQNREQHLSLQSLTNLQSDYERALQTFNTAVTSIDNMRGTVLDQAELKIAMPFLDIRDALVRGLAAAQFSDHLSGDRHPGMAGIVQGYEMALRRFDRALAQIDIQTIATVGRPFDAAEMKAVGTACQHEQAAGVVLEEHLSGFKRNGRVIRTAEVIVNRHELGHDIQQEALSPYRHQTFGALN